MLDPIASNEDLGKCARHAMKPARTKCLRCGAGLCEQCESNRKDNGECPVCAYSPTGVVDPGARVSVPVPSPSPSLPPPPPAIAPPPIQRVFRPAEIVQEKTTCRAHPSVPVVRRCSACAQWICGTCAFDLPGRLVICPTCAMDSAVQGLGPRRKSNVIWGYVLAGIATVVFTALIAAGAMGMLDGNNAAIDLVGSTISLICAAIGFGMASSAMERHLPNPWAVSIAVGWNGVLLLLFLLLRLAMTFGLL